MSNLEQNTLVGQYTKATVNNKNWNYDGVRVQVRALKNQITALQNLLELVAEKGSLLTSNGMIPFIFGFNCDPDAQLPSIGVMETAYDSLPRASFPPDFLYDGLIASGDGDFNVVNVGFLDGVTFFRSDTIILTAQDNPVNNGLYVVYDLGSAIRPAILVRPSELLVRGRLITEFDATFGPIPSTALFGLVANANGNFNLTNIAGLEGRSYGQMDNILLTEQSDPLANINYYIYDLGDPGNPAILVIIPPYDYDILPFTNETVIGVESGLTRTGSKWEVMVGDSFILNTDNLNVKLFCKGKALTTNLSVDPDALEWQDLDHMTDVTNVGTNTHKQIDEHVGYIVRGSKGTMLLGCDYVGESPSVKDLPVAPDGQILYTNPAPCGLRWKEILQKAPTDQKGDMLSHDGTLDSVLKIGELNQMLMVNSASSNGMKWVDPPPPADLLFSQKGELLTYDGADQALLSVGANGTYLFADSAEALGIKWDQVVLANADTLPFNQKGDIMTRIVGAGSPVGTDGPLVSVPVGPDGYVLTVNTNVSSGLVWTDVFGIRPKVTMFRKTSSQAAFNFSFPPGIDMILPPPLDSLPFVLVEMCTYQRVKSWALDGVDEIGDSNMNNAMVNGQFSPSQSGIYNIQVTIKWNPPSVLTSTATFTAPPCTAHEMHVQWSELSYNTVTYQVLNDDISDPISDYFDLPVIGPILQDIADDLGFVPLADDLQFTSAGIDAEHTIAEAAGLTPSNVLGLSSTVTLNHQFVVTQTMIDDGFTMYLRGFSKIDPYAGDIDLTSSIPLPQVPGLPFHWSDMQGSESPSTDAFSQIIVTRTPLSS